MSLLDSNDFLARLVVVCKLGAGKGSLSNKLRVVSVFLDHEGVFREGEVRKLDADRAISERDVLDGCLFVCSIISY